jgi:hypothetical protein
MTKGIYAPDGSQRVTVAGSESGSDLADLATAIGAPDDAAWNGTDPEASLISIQKAIYAAVSA